MAIAIDLRQRLLMERITVFAGSFDLGAYRALYRSGTLRDLDELVSHGLLHVVAASDPLRWTVPTGQDCSDHPRAGSHAIHYANAVQIALPHLHGSEQGKWLDLLESDLPNLRAAIRWTLDTPGHQTLGLEIAVGCFPLWMKRGHLAEGLEWIRKCLADCPVRPSPLRLEALNCTGAMLAALGDPRGGRALLREALHLVWECRDRPSEAAILVQLGLTFRDEGDLDEARKALAGALAILKEHPAQRVLATTLLHLGSTLSLHGAHDRAATLMLEAQQAYAALGDPWGVAAAEFAMAESEYLQMEFGEARARLRVALTVLGSLKDVREVGKGFSLLSQLESRAGRWTNAAFLSGAADSARYATFGEIAPVDLERTLANVLELRERLGDAVFDDAWSQGHDMRWDDVVQCILAASESAHPLEFHA